MAQEVVGKRSHSLILWTAVIFFTQQVAMATSQPKLEVPLINKQKFETGNYLFMKATELLLQTNTILNCILNSLLR